MYKVVVDTVVFVRALINPKSRCGRLLFEYAERLDIILSKPTAQELLEVIQRPELTTKYTRLGRIRIAEVIGILARAQAVEIGTPKPLVRDPKDDISVATALAGQADYLITEDNDLLVLGDTLGFSIVNTSEFLDILANAK